MKVEALGMLPVTVPGKHTIDVCEQLDAKCVRTEQDRLLGFIIIQHLIEAH